MAVDFCRLFDLNDVIVTFHFCYNSSTYKMCLFSTYLILNIAAFILYPNFPNYWPNGPILMWVVVCLQVFLFHFLPFPESLIYAFWAQRLINCSQIVYLGGKTFDTVVRHFWGLQRDKTKGSLRSHPISKIRHVQKYLTTGGRGRIISPITPPLTLWPFPHLSPPISRLPHIKKPVNF